jgi:hypothetical protein
VVGFVLCGICIPPDLRRKHYRAASAGGDVGDRLEVLSSPTGRLGGRARGLARPVDVVEHVMTGIASTFVEGIARRDSSGRRGSRAASSCGVSLPFN